MKNISDLVEKISEKYKVDKCKITIDLVKYEGLMFQKEMMKKNVKNPTTYFYLAAGHIIDNYKFNGNGK